MGEGALRPLRAPPPFAMSLLYVVIYLKNKLSFLKFQLIYICSLGIANFLAVLNTSPPSQLQFWFILTKFAHRCIYTSPFEPATIIVAVLCGYNEAF